jgi:hypothetical protein
MTVSVLHRSYSTTARTVRLERNQLAERRVGPVDAYQDELFSAALVSVPCLREGQRLDGFPALTPLKIDALMIDRSHRLGVACSVALELANSSASTLASSNGGRLPLVQTIRQVNDASGVRKP